MGAVFPAWVIDHEVETEGFAGEFQAHVPLSRLNGESILIEIATIVLARKLGARIVGLPNYVVLHR